MNLFTGFKILLFLFLFLFWGVFVEFIPTKSRIHFKLLEESSQRQLPNRYLISSELNYGRLSNLKISITEVIGLSLALNMTAILPNLESCIKPTEDLGWSGIIEIDQLFDTSAFSRASVVSSSGLDLNRVCGQDTVAITVSNFGIPKPTVKGEVSINLADIKLSEPFFFGRNVPFGDIFSTYPYNDYFLHEVTEFWASNHMIDQLLPDKLATMSNHRCIVLGRNFMSLNWARLPTEFEEVQRELIPNPYIRADVFDFLSKLQLYRPFSPLSSSTVVPFIAIHLRMGDFLTLDSHRGFGFDCNNNPDLLISRVRDILTHYPERTPIVLATDDYRSKCASNFLTKFSVIVLEEASRFYSKSCQGALFDQEVLGASIFFIGDKMSTFSQTIHQIRTLRYLHPVDSTIWL